MAIDYITNKTTTGPYTHSSIHRCMEGLMSIKNWCHFVGGGMLALPAKYTSGINSVQSYMIYIFGWI